MIRFAAVAVLAMLSMHPAYAAEAFEPKIPVTWVDSEMAELELPLANERYSPVHVPSKFYYEIPARTFYKSYPVYHPDYEPNGYLERLMANEPEIIFDRSRLKTKEDWIQAGKMLFESSHRTARGAGSAAEIRQNLRRWIERWGVPTTPEGIVSYRRYVVREKGKVELQANSCASCHTRLMPDGSVIVGAQGNAPGGAAFFGAPPKALLHSLTDALWNAGGEASLIDSLSEQKIISHLKRLPGGVFPRNGTSFLYPVAAPDLIGVEDRRYLDRTGLQMHRGIVDLMRHASINFRFDLYADYGGFRPFSALRGSRHARWPEAGELNRYSDAQLYAIALYVYSLKPPPNPNAFDDRAQRGQKVFYREGCDSCHTPPLYTNNKITPVAGFKGPAEHCTRYDIQDIVVGTDPNLALA